MADINRLCNSCHGSGTIQYYGGPAQTCDACEGSGEILLATIDLSALEDKIDDIMNKCNDIADAIEALE